MSIASEIKRIEDAKASIKKSLEAKEIMVGDATLDQYAVKIDETEIGAEKNIFTQQSEPTTKDGFWFENEEEININKIIVKNNLNEMINDRKIDFETDYGTLPYVMSIGWECAKVGDYIYFFGADNQLYDACKYNIKTHTFETIKSTPINTARAGVSAVGTNVYIFGGGHNSRASKTIYKYDTLNDTYELVGNLNVYFTLGNTITVGTDIYIFGGFNASKQKAYKFDTLTNTLTNLTSIPFEFAYGRIAEYKGDIYLFGGYISPNTAYKYNIANNSYTQLTNIPIGFNLGNLAIIGKYIYLFMNQTQYIYHTDTNMYEKLEDLPLSIGVTPLLEIFENNIFKILVFGYNDLNNSYVQNCVSYDISLQELENNSLIVFTNNLNKSTQLYNDKDLDGKLPIYFEDVALYEVNNGYLLDAERYYGDGTKWIEIN